MYNAKKVCYVISENVLKCKQLMKCFIGWENWAINPVILYSFCLSSTLGINLDNRLVVIDELLILTDDICPQKARTYYDHYY